MNEKKEFKPFIPADQVVPEFTATSIILGLVLAVSCHFYVGSGRHL